MNYSSKCRPHLNEVISQGLGWFVNMHKVAVWPTGASTFIMLPTASFTKVSHGTIFARENAATIVAPVQFL